MTQGILLLLAIAAVWFVIAWSIRNDKAKSIDDETGFIRLRRVRGQGDDGDPATRTQAEGRRARVRGRTSRKR